MKTALSCLLVMATVILSAYPDAGSAKDKITVGVIIGPSGMGMSKIMADPQSVQGLSVSFEKMGSIDALIPKLINGDIDVGILPPNIAAKLYNKAPKTIAVAAIVGNAMLSLITTDETIKSIKDLAGKTVYVAGQGSTPEYALRTIIAKSGVPANAITLNYSIPYQEIASAIASGTIQYALVPEPFATVAIMKASSTNQVRRAFALRDVWKAYELGDDFPMTLCVVRKSYAEKNSAAVRRFLAAYRESVSWTVAHPDDAGTIIEKTGLGLKASVAARSIPACNFTWIEPPAAKTPIESLLSVFLTYAPESIGGKLPDEGFYLK